MCAPFFLRDLELSIATTRAIIGLGSFAWDAIFKTLKEMGHPIKKVKFAHGASLKYSHEGRDYLLLASYHPSQQNTFTGKLTRPMLGSILKKGGRFASVVQ
jgi:uracil-DNA glycosylase